MSKKWEMIDYTINSLIELLMKKYSASYDWAFQTVMKSETYKRLLNDNDFLNEGDLFIFETLDKELKQNLMKTAENVRIMNGRMQGE